jgi:hypothetical protein
LSDPAQADLRRKYRVRVSYAPLIALAAGTEVNDRGAELTTENLVRTGAAPAISGDENRDAQSALESNLSAICGSN